MVVAIYQRIVIFSVMLSQLETMGRIPIGFCGFSLRNIVLRFCVWQVVCKINAMAFGGSDFLVAVLIYCLLGLLVCVWYFLLVVWSLRCFIVSSMYSLLSWTTIVDPLLYLLLALGYWWVGLGLVAPFWLGYRICFVCVHDF